jgi:hypothetical protein
MGFDRAEDIMKAWRWAMAVAMMTAPVAAQEEGWHYSPLAGEGDRATLGCAPGSNAETFVCMAVRCEDDYSTGIHIHTSRSQGDAGEWLLTIDKENRTVRAVAEGSPYGARIAGNGAWVLDRLQQGALAYLHRPDGEALPHNGISLDGSLHAINRALAFCAPRVPAETTIEPNAANDVVEKH